MVPRVRAEAFNRRPGTREVKVLMQWENERRLVFMASEKWSGWICARCCWNRPKPASEEERRQLAAQIEAEFRQHSCEKYAPDHWRKQ